MSNSVAGVATMAQKLLGHGDQCSIVIPQFDNKLVACDFFLQCDPTPVFSGTPEKSGKGYSVVVNRMTLAYREGISENVSEIKLADCQWFYGMMCRFVDREWQKRSLSQRLKPFDSLNIADMSILKRVYSRQPGKFKESTKGLHGVSNYMRSDKSRSGTFSISITPTMYTEPDLVEQLQVCRQ